MYNNYQAAKSCLSLVCCLRGRLPVGVSSSVYLFPLSIFIAFRVQRRGITEDQGGSSFRTLKDQVRKELEVKKSKFVAVGFPVTDEPGALKLLSQLEQLSDPRATHNCWAMKIGQRYRFSDDGEPGGTAGRPIYAAIEGSGLDHIMVLVIRYFGGIKLGTGGLVRAYGGIASDCLKDADVVVVKSKIPMMLRVPYNLLGTVYSLLQRYHLEREEEYYEDSHGGGVCLKLYIEVDIMEEVKAVINDACRGQVNISLSD